MKYRPNFAPLSGALRLPATRALSVSVAWLAVLAAASGQNAPLPGVDWSPPATATGGLPATTAYPAAVPSVQAGSPLPGASGKKFAASAGDSAYRALPLAPGDAKLRIEELKNLMLIAKPQEIQDRVYNLCEWLVDMTEAHNKLAAVFSRQETMKAACQSEKAMAQKFAHLKNEAQLIKADLLVKENRTPEALGPLVDIVINEPKGSAGQAAYHRLKELGFSEEVQEAPTLPVASNPKPDDVLASGRAAALKVVPAHKKPGEHPAAATR